MTTNDQDERHDEEEMDPRLVAGWEALESGDVAAARAAAKSYPQDGPLRVEALMLEAACQREEDDRDGALATLEKAAKAEPDWATPELWMAEMLLDDGEQLEEALKHARRALDLAEEEDEYLSAVSTKAAIELGLERPAEARKTLKELPPADTVLDDVPMTLDLAQLLLEAGNPGDARARLETLVKASPEEADAWYYLGLTAEATGDEDRKREAWLKTRELDIADADHHAHHHHHDGDDAHEHLTEETLIEVAEETLEEMPDQLRDLLSNVPIVVAERPALADVEAGTDPRVLGLFNGASHGQAGSTGEVPGVTEIVLFRQNIERVAGDDDELRDEIRLTMLHEAGHFFGFDEEGLERMGLD